MSAMNRPPGKRAKLLDRKHSNVESTHELYLERYPPEILWNIFDNTELHELRGLLTVSPVMNFRVKSYASNPFELLPPKLMWKIFDYSLESLYELRLTSPLLRTHVDEYTLHVPELTIVDELVVRACWPQFSIEMLVSKERRSLLERRLVQKWCTAIAKSQRGNCFVYKILLDQRYYMKEGWLEILGECMGGRIGKLTLLQCNIDSMLTLMSVISKLVGVMQFSKLKIQIKTISDDFINHLLHIIKINGVEQLSLLVHKFAITNPVEVLLQLSWLVCALEIDEYFSQYENTNYLFGVYDADWAAIIVEMFSRKLDKLTIQNRFNFLPQRGVEMLMANLPALERKVFFETSCYVLERNFEYSVNDYLVQGEQLIQRLSIKHISRPVINMDSPPFSTSSVEETEFLSPFEQLPSELLRSIIAYAPESVYELRLICRLLKTLVDECAQAPLNGQIIEELSVYTTKPMEIQDELAMLFAVTFYVPKHLSNIFEHRLKFCRHNFVGHKVYNIRLVTSHAEDLLILQRVCMGKRVGKLVLINCTGPVVLAAVSKLIEGLKFDLMEFTAVNLLGDDEKFILISIPEHHVKHLAVNMNTVTDPVKFLLDLSSIIQSLYIYQCRIEAIPWKAPFLFGLLDVSWAPVILEMFTRKMDKLYIENHYFEGYLGMAESDLLMACLPSMGKKIWFEATCTNYPPGLDLTDNEHWIQVDHRYMHCRFLRIKHVSRINEPHEFPRIQ